MGDVYFERKVAIVTGAGGKLCSVIAKHLAERGCYVVLIGRTFEKLKKTADSIHAVNGTCMIKTADVCDEESLQKIADEVKEEWGSCRFLINGAGGNNNKAITTNYYFDPLELSDEKPEEMRGFFDLDMDKCVACGACAIACMDQNDIKPDEGEKPFRTVGNAEPVAIGDKIRFLSSG